MPGIAIRVDDIAKSYRLGQQRGGYDTLRDQITRGVTRLTKPGSFERKSGRATLWALDGVSLEVKKGEVIGVIGRNGAGKTTLLKILSRITEPTRGRVEIHGRLGSLLEVGTGFHPELTGRENISLNGAILGMRRTEIQSRFDEIVEFAGVGKFIDTPVKRYSSGMYVRLAFSVAAHLEPEILLVDEVLAVGDAEFQRKCLGKMQSVGEAGRTVLLVSHNMQAITRLCHRAVLLEQGRVVEDGPATAVVPRYLQGDMGSTSERAWPILDEAPGDELTRLRNVRVVDADGVTARAIDVRQPVGIEIRFDILTGSGPPVVPQLMLTNEQGLISFQAMNTDPRWREVSPSGTYTTTAWIPGNLLNEGLMTVSVFLSTLASGKVVQHAFERDIVSFQVQDGVEGDSAKGHHVGQWWGAVRPLLDWTTETRG